MAWIKWRGTPERGRWHAFWTESIGGKARKRSRRLSRDRKTADKMLVELERNLELKGVGLGQLVTVARLAADYLTLLKSNNCAPSYVERVRIILAHVERLFPRLRLASLTANLVDQYKLKRLEEKIAPSTVNREVGAIKAAARKAKRFQYQVPDLSEVGKVRVAEKLLKPFNAVEVVIALERAAPLLAIVLRLGLYLGLRRMEILALRWTNIDFKQGVIILGDGWKTKSGKLRALPMHPRLTTALKAWRKALEAAGPLPERVVPWTATPQALTGRLVYFLRRKCGIAAGSIHSLRRTFMTELKRADVDTGKAMRLGGHATEKVMQGYVKLDVADLREGVGRLNYEEKHHGRR